MYNYLFLYSIKDQHLTTYTNLSNPLIKNNFGETINIFIFNTKKLKLSITQKIF